MFRDYFKEQIIRDIEKIWIYDNYERLDETEDWNLCEYKIIVHYNQNNTWEDYPAKVWIMYKLWNYEYYIYEEWLVYNEDEKIEVANRLIKEVRTNIKDWWIYQAWINAWETIWWNWKYISMIWWAYNIYKVPNWYIATWKVANQWTWHVWSVWKDKEVLEQEVLRILDDWQKRNKNEPLSEEYDGRSEVEIPFEDLWDSITLSSLNIEFKSIYSEIEQNCMVIAQAIYSLTWEWSTSDSWNNQVEYVQSCIVNTEFNEKVKKTFIEALLFEYQLLSWTYQTMKWFFPWYYKAVQDQWYFLARLEDDLERIVILEWIQKWLNDWSEYTLNLIAYYWANIRHMLNRNDMSIIHDINYFKEKLSFAAEIIELEELIRSIDWDTIENKEYWLWYVYWYLAENMVVWIATGVVWTAVYVQSMNKLKILIEKIRIASKIWILGNRKIDLNLLEISLTDSEVIKFSSVISANFPWYSASKKARFLQRMLHDIINQILMI